MCWAVRLRNIRNAEVEEALAPSGAGCNQAAEDGRMPLGTGSCCHLLKCAEVLLMGGADVNEERCHTFDH